MKKALSLILSLLLLLGCVPLTAFAGDAPSFADSYEEYDMQAVSEGETEYINALSTDAMASLVMDWIDRIILKNSADFENFEVTVFGAEIAESLPEVCGVDSLVAYAPYLELLGGDFVSFDVSALDSLTRENGDVYFIAALLEFIADNALQLSKLTAWSSDSRFEAGALGSYIASLDTNNKKYALIAALITTVVIALIVAAVYFVFLKNSDGLSASSSQPSSVIEISSSEESSVSSEADPLVKLYSVPDVKGMTYSQVLSAKRDNGDFYTDDFAFEIELKQYSDKYAAGQVISQNPEAGKSVEKGEKIKLVISLGSYKTKVPNVAGYTEEEALIELLKAGFSYDSIHVVDKYDESELPSVAIETSPAQNEQVNTDEGITLYINSYNGPESSSQTNTTETVTSGDTSQ